MKRNGFLDTALLCTNVWTALGVQKVMAERGLKVGKAISVCAINDEMLGPWLHPALTALRMPNIESILAKCMEWMIFGPKNWQGPKLLTPKNVPLIVRIRRFNPSLASMRAGTYAVQPHA